MPSLFTMPAAIACAHADVHSRKITPGSALEFKGMGTCIRYKCQRNSDATVTDELDPKKCKHDPKAYLSTNDSIHGEDISVWVKGNRAQKIGKLSNYTGTHSVGYFHTNNETYARLTLQFHNIPK